MKNRIKLITILLLVSSVSAFATSPKDEVVKTSDQTFVTKSYGYLDIGVGPLPLPIPSFGMGYRNQLHHHGCDLSLRLSTIVFVTQVKSNFLYHYYFKPNLASQFYIGGGLGISGLFSNSHKIQNGTMCFSPEFVLGKEYKNESGDRRFAQVQISWPTYSFKHFSDRNFSDCRILYMPLVVFSYGIGF
jgi:hypothetical protein